MFVARSSCVALQLHTKMRTIKLGEILRHRALSSLSHSKNSRQSLPLVNTRADCRYPGENTHKDRTIPHAAPDAHTPLYTIYTSPIKLNRHSYQKAKVTPSRRFIRPVIKRLLHSCARSAVRIAHMGIYSDTHTHILLPSQT